MLIAAFSPFYIIMGGLSGNAILSYIFDSL